jgi:hypothetical protein
MRAFNFSLSAVTAFLAPGQALSWSGGTFFFHSHG